MYFGHLQIRSLWMQKCNTLKKSIFCFKQQGNNWGIISHFILLRRSKSSRYVLFLSTTSFYNAFNTYYHNIKYFFLAATATAEKSLTQMYKHLVGTNSDLNPSLAKSRRKHFQRCLSRGSVISYSNTAPCTQHPLTLQASQSWLYGDCPLLSCINAKPKQTTFKYSEVRLSTNARYFSSATLLQLPITTITVKSLQVL